MEMLNQKQKMAAVIIIAIIIVVIGYYYINSTKDIYSMSSKDEIENIVETSEEEENKQKERKIIVHITGEVEKEGIVEIEENARINDVIEAAGGITKNADLSKVNLAYIVEDGQKIYIPSKEENAEKGENDNEIEHKNIVSNDSGRGVIQGEETKGNLININKADKTELMELPGIGESTALKIVEYRKTNGKFKTVEDLKNVSGIGDAKFNNIKSFISI